MKRLLGDVICTLLGTAFIAFTASRASFFAAGQLTETSYSDDVDATGAAGSSSSPIVGIGNFRPVCADVTSSSSSSTATDDDEMRNACTVSQLIIEAMEQDDLLNVVIDERGELVCDSLENAEDAPLLRFRVSSTEVVEAEVKSYAMWPASAFSNKKSRKVWTGDVVEDDDFEGLPRSISMTWSDCDVEAFLLQMIVPAHDGRTISMTTVPCELTSGIKELCILQVMREGEEECDGLPHSISFSPVEEGSEPTTSYSYEYEYAATAPPSATRTRQRSLRQSPGTRTAQGRGGAPGRKLEVARSLAREVEEGVATSHANDPDLKAKDADLHLLNRYLLAGPSDIEEIHEQGLRRISSDEIAMPSGRRLMASNTIDVMVLYTEKSMAGISGANLQSKKVQMETDIITAYEGANNALKDSLEGGDSVTLNVVHMQWIDYEESDDISDAVFDLHKGDRQASGVHELRDEYGADLVQLVGFYLDTCGIGFTMKVPTAAFAPYGYSVVHTNCLVNFSHIHEIGHNLGANHDRINSDAVHDYAHGFRQCKGNNAFRYRTIMAYETGCLDAPRVNIFSSPKHEYANVMQGSEKEDNAKAILESATVAANFRESVSTLKSQNTGINPSVVSTTTGPITPSPSVDVEQPWSAPEPTDAPTTSRPSSSKASPKPNDAPTASPAPTPKPTEKPTTEQPTVKWTEEPTVKPTKEPTEKPTVKSTEEPTEKPTVKSTEEPTVTPTEAPTVKPTKEPTEKPTVESTEKPTENPTTENSIKDTPETPSPSASPGTARVVVNPKATSQPTVSSSSGSSSTSTSGNGEGGEPSAESPQQQQPSATGGQPTTEVSIYPEAIFGKRMRWKGCYQDDADDRVMTNKESMPAIDGVTIGMTHDNCMAHCYNLDMSFKFFGVENGKDCFCAADSEEYERLGELASSSCETPCAGDETATCGGKEAIGVFRIKNEVIDYDVDAQLPHYEGCFNDTASDFEMANVPVIDSHFTTQESCDVHCEDAGYGYFALEFGFLCQCGDVLPNPERGVGDELCDLPCANPGTNRTCGGNWHSAIYAVGVLESLDILSAATSNLTDDVVDDDVDLFSDDGRGEGFGPRGVPTFGTSTEEGGTESFVTVAIEDDDFEGT